MLKLGLLVLNFRILTLVTLTLLLHIVVLIHIPSSHLRLVIITYFVINVDGSNDLFSRIP